MRNLTPPAKIYLFGLVLAAAALGWYLVSRAGVPQGERLVLALILTALSMVTNARMVYFTSDRGISLGFAPAFAALLLFDPGVAITVALAGVLAANLINRQTFYYALCDAADAVLSVGCASLILSVGGDSGAGFPDDPGYIGPALVAAVVMFMINVLDWAIVYVLNDEGSWRSELREIWDGAHVLAFCLEIALGFLMAWLSVRMPWTLIFLTIPAYGAFIMVERQVRARRRTQDSLVRTEASLANAQRIAHVGSWEWSVDTDLMMWSDETYRILGLAPQERVATREEYMGNAHPADQTSLQEAMELAAATGESFDLEYRVARPGGEARCVYLRGEVEQHSGEQAKLFGTLLDITERKELEQRLEYQAYHDALTGLPNRALFTDRLEVALSRKQRDGGQVAVLLLDLDGFKNVNDTMGHKAGDILLQVVSDRLTEVIRPHDTVARLGGDEFVLLIDATDGTDVAKVAERVIEAVRAPHEIHGQRTRIAASVGIALNGENSNPDWLLRAADVAMYEAKRGGRGRYRFHAEPDHPRDFGLLLG
ncbi:MAG: diguanylate cyclase [Rubrobacter sp.]|nr:diguanylate cyclase [Rubrobacter sp.]